MDSDRGRTNAEFDGAVMTAVIDARTTMKLPLLRRRPEVNTLGLATLGIVEVVPRLDAPSQQIAGRIFHVAWLVVGLWRSADVAQPVYQQLELGRVAADLRQMSIALGRYYPSAPGRVTLALTADAAVAFANLESWDAMTVPTFDTTSTLLRLMAGVRFQ